MLDGVTIKKIEDFVYQKPRSIQELAVHLGKNWRTVDRYIEEIQKNFGTISTRVFREGTRGALKLVFWSSVEKISHSVFQEELEEEILRARRKEDFSAFDIFQYVKDSNKKAKIRHSKNEEEIAVENIADLYSKAEKQIFSFSGNLSFINYKSKGKEMFKIIEDLVKRDVNIKIICRVDIASKENVEKMLSLNSKYGKESIEIHHREHPLRATIFDKKFFHIKEIKEPTGKINELDKKIFISYIMRDREWTEWLSKIFWKIFNSSIDAKKRLEELEKLR